MGPISGLRGFTPDNKEFRGSVMVVFSCHVFFFAVVHVLFVLLPVIFVCSLLFTSYILTKSPRESSCFTAVCAEGAHGIARADNPRPASISVRVKSVQVGNGSGYPSLSQACSNLAGYVFGSACDFLDILD